MLTRIQSILREATSSVASLIKVALLSKSPTPPPIPPDPDASLIIMGNGPSLRDTIDNYSDVLSKTPLMAVNFAANAPDFNSLKPAFYVLADPHFFNAHKSDPNVETLWKNLAMTSWPMTLHVPAAMRRHIPGLPQNVSIATFNTTPAEGYDSVCFRLYDDGLAMPRPRNVLIPAIMTAIRSGFRNIYLSGADHTWSKTLWVDGQNRVISVQPHFYKDNEKELDRVAAEYAGYHIHDIFKSLSIAFESYHRIARYATKRGVRIFNATPGSFIDAFPRVSPGSLRNSISPSSTDTPKV